MRGKSLKFKEVECPELAEGQTAVYILLCKDSSYYVGYTNNLKRRLHDHNASLAAAWTAKRLPVKLIYCEIFNNHLEASRRERQLKGWTREKKEKLIFGLL